MTMTDTERFYVKVLNNYSEKLKKLNDDDEFSINEVTKCDLIKEASDVEGMLMHIEKNGTLYEDFNIFAYGDYRKLTCHALESYLYDLKNSIQAVKDRLGIEKVEFVLTSKEIERAEKNHRQLCQKEK